jgi:ubiquinone/menaquinone biosynthesis C-methylase UbiE
MLENMNHNVRAQDDHKKQLQTFYNEAWSVGPSHGREDEYRRRIQAHAIAFAIEKLDTNLEGKKVLEIGPGRGVETITIAQRGAHVIAADFSTAGLKAIRRLRSQSTPMCGKVTPVLMDAHALALQPRSIDYVFIQTTLMHLDWRIVGQAIAEGLKEGGKAIIIEPLNNNPLLLIYRSIFSPYRATSPNFLSFNDLKTLGQIFKSSSYHTFYLCALLTLPIAKYERVYAWLSKPLMAIDRWLFSVWPALQSWSWLAVAEYTVAKKRSHCILA